jgi:hypothetical protein
MIKVLVAESDALPPAEPMAGLPGVRACDLYARLAAQGTEHDRDLPLHLGQRYRLIGVNRIARRRTDHAMPGASDCLLQFKEIEHGLVSADDGLRDVHQRSLDLLVVSKRLDHARQHGIRD